MRSLSIFSRVPARFRRFCVLGEAIADVSGSSLSWGEEQRTLLAAELDLVLKACAVCRDRRLLDAMRADSPPRLELRSSPSAAATKPRPSQRPTHRGSSPRTCSPPRASFATSLVPTRRTAHAVHVSSATARPRSSPLFPCPSSPPRHPSQRRLRPPQPPQRSQSLLAPGTRRRARRTSRPSYPLSGLLDRRCAFRVTPMVVASRPNRPISCRGSGLRKNQLLFRQRHIPPTVCHF